MARGLSRLEDMSVQTSQDKAAQERSTERWAVILAGGSGVRLEPLTRRLFGDGINGEGCPKQFCTLFGDKTLLHHTRARISPIVLPERTAYAVVRAHHPYYRRQLAEVAPQRIFVQPANRGTTAGIAFALARIAAICPDAIVGFFPADHYFADEYAFVETLDRAYCLAEQHPESILLLGAAPEHPEVEYGWIEPCGERAASEAASPGSSLFRVRRFWEKPSPELARKLFDAGCLWNTFVMLAQVQAFLAVLKQSVPEVFRAFEPLIDPSLSSAPHQADALTVQAYNALASGDFSRQVLSAIPERLAVLRLENAGWSDLGTPERLMATWSRYGLSPSPAIEHARACSY